MAVNDSTLKDVNSANGLLSLVQTTMFEQFYELAKKESIGCFEPVIVKKVATDGNSAQISFPTDPTVISSYYYPNRTGYKLAVGNKVYLEHKIDDQSQGWLISSKYISPCALEDLTITSQYTIQSGSYAKKMGNIVFINIDVFNSGGFSYASTYRIADISGIKIATQGECFGANANNQFPSGSVRCFYQMLVNGSATEVNIYPAYGNASSVPETCKRIVINTCYIL